MLEQLRRLLEGRLRPALEAPERADEQALRLAAAALLVEVARTASSTVSSSPGSTS